ncbi:MAG: hypothetical protein AB7G05_12375 [Hyphomonadaceae bacterium]
MRSMLFASFAAGAAMLAFTGPAAADAASDRTSAIALCRAEISQRTGVAVEDVRLDTVRTRARAIRADFDVWRDGQLLNVSCSVSGRGEAQTIAAISPDLQTETASR